jgi:hypothetical protein
MRFALTISGQPCTFDIVIRTPPRALITGPPTEFLRTKSALGGQDERVISGTVRRLLGSAFAGERKRGVEMLGTDEQVLVRAYEEYPNARELVLQKGERLVSEKRAAGDALLILVALGSKDPRVKEKANERLCGGC